MGNEQEATQNVIDHQKGLNFTHNVNENIGEHINNVEQKFIGADLSI